MRVFLMGINGYLGRVLAEHFAHVPEIEGITGIDHSKASASSCL